MLTGGINLRVGLSFLSIGANSISDNLHLESTRQASKRSLWLLTRSVGWLALAGIEMPIRTAEASTARSDLVLFIGNLGEVADKVNCLPFSYSLGLSECL
jgi:hypothetical protein